MTAGLAAPLAADWLNVFRNTAVSAIAQPYFKLHVGDPGAAGTANAAAGDTSRKAASYAAPSGGSMSQTGAAPLWTNGGATETITYISVWDALTSGTFKYSFPLTAPVSWVSANTFSLPTYSFGIVPIAA